MAYKYLQFLFQEPGYTPRIIGRTPTLFCKKSVKECPVYKGLVGIKVLPTVDDPDTVYANQLQYLNAITVTFPEDFGVALPQTLCNRYRDVCKECRRENMSR